MRLVRLLVPGLMLALLVGCGADTPNQEHSALALFADAEAPPSPPPEWMPLIGEYAEGADTLSVLEDDHTLYLLTWGAERDALSQSNDSTLEIDGTDRVVSVRRSDMGSVSGLDIEGRFFTRLSLGGEEGETFQITPVRSPVELRAEALAAVPPEEEGDFVVSDLVEVTSLDQTIRLDIRYATTNNFMGEVFYSSPRAFLQRPAAEAVVRAHEWLSERGYGILIHDGYRPWYVTKMFWDATPEHLKNFVANPASGSRHNRGCAVDLTLYDIETGEVVLMPAGFDEMSPRSHVDYQGGTDRQRWYRDLLRAAMEAQGFTVYEDEWWHFDYEGWEQYRIGNEVFEEIGR